MDLRTAFVVMIADDATLDSHTAVHVGVAV